MRSKRAGRGGAGEVRIIAGTWRRRRIHFPVGPGIRPTPDRLRETLFNWLGEWIIGRRVLDLFAGSGALGIEALSRGAAEAVFVERNRQAARALSENLRGLGVVHAGVVKNAEALAWLAAARQGFDLVLADPPYSMAAGSEVLDLLDAHALLGDDHRVYLEQRRERSASPLPEGWEILRTSRAGDAQGLLIKHE